MSLLDHVTPSERAVDLAFNVRRLRRIHGLDPEHVVSMLVVEGRTDEPALGSLCVYGDAQVFSAGSRDLVEQMLIYLDARPIDHCRPAYLTDCDGHGKTSNLAHRRDLVVTQTCDLEADLVVLGTLGHCLRPFLTSDEQAQALVTRAVRIVLPFAVVRRAANRAGVSMKRDARQVRFHDFPEQYIASWEPASPTDQQALAQVGAFMGWQRDETARVEAQLATLDRDHRRCALGRDLLDSAFRLIRREGIGQVRGWTRDHFLTQVRTSLSISNVEDWEVTRRLTSWSEAQGVPLLRAA